MVKQDYVREGNDTIPLFADVFGHQLRVDRHGHECIEIAYIIKGTAMHWYEGQSVFLAAGDVVIISPHAMHGYAQNQSVTVFNCQFVPSLLQSDINWLRNIEGFFDLFMVEPFFRREVRFRDKLHVPEEYRASVEEHFHQIRDELRMKQTGYELAAKTHLIQLIIALCRLYNTQTNRSPWTQELGTKNALLHEAIRYIEEHMTQRIQVEELAAAFYLSPDHFSRLFRQSTGVSPIEYINHLRISKASQLLASGTKSIAEVASQVGIQDPSYFARVFKQITGQTPAAFRNEHRGQSKA